MAPELKLSHTDINATRARRREQKALWRLSAWGGAAALALTAVALASQTETGGQRLQLAFGGTKEPSTAAMVAAADRRADEAQAETRRLAAQLSELRSDRDRLNARLASLERNLADVTGSISRQIAQAAANRAAAPPAAAPLPPIEPLAMPALQSAAAPWSEAPAQPQAKPPAPPAAASALPSIAAAPPATAATPSPAAATPPHTAAAPPLKPPIVVGVPMPPVRVATLPIRPQTAPPPKPEFGIDVGGALLTNFLAARWAEIKANFGPELVGLYPMVARDPRFGHAPYRLLIGPLPSAAAATQLCTRLGLNRSGCRPARFAGERLAQY